MPTKRKRSSATANALSSLQETPLLSPSSISKPPISRRASKRSKVDTNPDHNGDIIDGKAALRASPDTEAAEAVDVKKIISGTPSTLTEVRGVELEQESEVIESLTNGNFAETQIAATGKKDKKLPTKSSIAAKKGFDEIKAFKAELAAKRAAGTKIKKENDEDEWSKGLDPDEDEPGPVEDADIEKIEGRRPPPVHSEYLPLPWKGRLGYVSTAEHLHLSRTNWSYRHASIRI
jgi:UV DNA damage endonuclease